MNRSPVDVDSRSIVGRYMNQLLVEDDPDVLPGGATTVLQ